MKQIDPEILKRYANGNCTAEEQTIVELWLDSDENESAHQDTFTGVDKEELKQELWAKLKPFSSSKPRYHLPALAYKFAACLALICSAAYFGIRYIGHQQENQPLASVLVYKELFVPKGNKATITLTDGTEISLNADSRLKYPIAFTGNSRAIYLSGEAHFKVAKDPSKPFLIHTNKTNTRILGTVFNLKAYPEENKELLTVEEGKVQFSSKSNPKKQLILTKNQQGTIDAAGILGQKLVYAPAHSGWRTKKLVFNDLTLKEISVLLNREYNVYLEIKNKNLSAKRFTGTYHNSSLNAVARDISLALHCKYQLNNQLLTFY